MKVLHLEDNRTDFELIRQQAKRQGLDWDSRQAESKEDFLAALDEGPWDLIISDFSLPSFSGKEALELVKVKAPETPFIYVSGTIGEEAAVESLLHGATDYVLKTNLKRLYPAIQRAIREAESTVERRRLDSELRKSEEKYRLIVNMAEEGIWLFDADINVVFANPKMAKMVGWSEEEMVGRPYSDFLDADARAQADAKIALRKRGVADVYEMRFTKKDGSELWATVSSRPLFDGEGRFNGILALLSDITERKSAELKLNAAQNQLRQAQKMEAIGRLAGGVAHDFNNILTAISGYSHFLIEGFPSGDPRRADAEEIKKAADRAASLTRQLLAFSRQQVLQPKVVELNALVAELDRMLKRIIGEHVRLETALAQGLPAIKADPGQIEQVILNLVVNARDAMPDGGAITISTAGADLSAAFDASRAGVKPGRYVALSVRDTGCGMDEATLARIFEPFFTTKGIGKGTGLGLSTVHGIIEQSGGEVRVESAPGKGSVFRVFLPIAVDAAPGADADAAGPRQASKGGETILLVEDDDGVRRFTARLLSHGGYKVLEASGPEEALMLFERHKESISLLLSDVIMPEMRGDELARSLTAQRPDLKVVLTSGYIEEGLVRQHIGAPGSVFLQKPVSPDALLRNIREALDSAKRA